MTTTQATDHLLFDLDEPVERYFVLHGGEPHFMATYEDLSINGRRRIGRTQARMFELERLDRDLTDSEEREYLAATDDVIRTVFPTFPAEAFEGMGLEKKEALATAFFTRRLVNHLARRMGEVIETNRDGQNSSPASSASTPSPTPPTGSSESLSDS